MLTELLKLYDESRINPGPPDCMFAETLIFNEGWLLRAVLQQWRSQTAPFQFDFLLFPHHVKICSEVQLYTPFKRQKQRDGHVEGNTLVDGIVGDFCLASGSKSGIVVKPDCKYLAVFEAKMVSALSKGVKYAATYSQVARIAACMIHAILEARCTEDFIPYLLVLYPQHNKGIKPAQYARARIETQITERIQNYLGYAEPSERDARFFHMWREVLERIHIQFLTWEEIVAEIDDPNLDRFYELCKRFN